MRGQWPTGTRARSPSGSGRWDNLRWKRDIYPCPPLALGGASPYSRAEAFSAQGKESLPQAQLCGRGPFHTHTVWPSCPTSAMALPLDSAPKCTLPLGWGTAPFWTVEKPETGEPHASPCGDPRTEEYDAVLRELKALMHTLVLTQAWPVFSSMVTWRILEMEK